jgi:hypothetical protein
MSSVNNYIINGINTYGLGTTVAQIAEGGLSLTTSTDNFSMNGLGFLYNGLGATWADVRQKVNDLKAVVAPPDITTLTVNNKIQVTDGISTTTINPASITSATFTGSLNGTANFASTTVVTGDNSSTITYPTFVLGTSGNQGQKVDTNLTYNAFTNTLTVPNVDGNASTATTATNSTVTADNTGSTFYPTFVSNTGTQGLKIDTGMSYVPSTDTLTVANVTGNASTSNSATTASNLNALNPITPYYLYPIASPANIGWTQVITTTGWTFNSITKAYACNTTPLVAGIYIMRAYVYCGNSSFFSGTQIINLVASNSFITNNSTSGFIDPSNASPMGYLYSRIPYNTGDSVNNAPFVVNNTGAGFYPYWAVAVNNSVQINPAGNGVPQMSFCRIA